MKHVLLSALAVLCLFALSCSTSPFKSTSCCEEACRIWEQCGWSYEVCTSECRDEGDWCGSYIDCIRGKSCRDLNLCE